MKRTVIAVLLVLVAVSAGCTDKGGSNESAATTTTLRASALAVNCPPYSATTTSALPERCLNAAFVETVNGKDVPEAVRKLGEEKQLAFGQGICAFAHVVAGGTVAAPLHQQFLRETAAAWKQPPAVVEAIYRNAAVLCPEDYLAIANLPKTASGAIAVELSVGGTGDATVTYTVPDGSSTQEKVTVPWTKILQLTDPIDVKVDATPGEGGKLSCAITVQNEDQGTSKQVASADGNEGTVTTCEAEAAAIDAANGGE